MVERLVDIVMATDYRTELNKSAQTTIALYGTNQQKTGYTSHNLVPPYHEFGLFCDRFLRFVIR
jgi:hypothetical protein